MQKVSIKQSEYKNGYLKGFHDCEKQYNTPIVEFKRKVAKEFAEEIKQLLYDGTYMDVNMIGEAVCVLEVEAFDKINELLKEFTNYEGC